VKKTLSCDVLVVGAGAAGVPAAVAAARADARTILVEKRAGPGGAAIVGMHRYICGLYVNGEDTPGETLNGGLVREICDRLHILTPRHKPTPMGKVHVLPFSGKDLEHVYRALISEEPGLQAVFNARVVSATMARKQIAGVEAVGADEQLRFVPKMVIDCSGDGIVVELSGARYRLARQHRRQLAGYTIRVKGLREVDETLAMKVPYYVGQGVREEALPSYLRFTTFMLGDRADEGFCKLSLPPAGRRADSQITRQAGALVHQYLARVLPAFEHSRIEGTSSESLEREGLRLYGKYSLNRDDVLGARTFDDGVVKNAWPIEIWDQKKGPTYKYLAPGAYYEIPLRCMESKDIANLFCAGRCISASPQALGSTRVTGPSMALGQEAGRAAAGRAAETGEGAA
jgi:hypothetical protein